VKPPWGTLNAIDLNTGEYRWRVPLGEFPELTARGIPPTGTENYGGPVVTGGGLLFIAASKDERIRAFRSAKWGVTMAGKAARRRLRHPGDLPWWERASSWSLPVVEARWGREVAMPTWPLLSRDPVAWTRGWMGGGAVARDTLFDEADGDFDRVGQFEQVEIGGADGAFGDQRLVGKPAQGRPEPGAHGHDREAVDLLALDEREGFEKLRRGCQSRPASPRTRTSISPA
jgi:hypothetical protein